MLRLIELCGANPVEVDAVDHDRAVAVVSHAPHVAAAAVAARLSDATDVALGLAGQGVRDVTRIAGGDPGLWLGILSGNAAPVAEVLEAVSHDLAEAASALRALADGDGTAHGEITQLLKRGVAGHDRIPGKRGGPAPAYVVVQVVIGDRPGQLARLFQICDEVGVNVEDVRLEHAPACRSASRSCRCSRTRPRCSPRPCANTGLAASLTPERGRARCRSAPGSSRGGVSVG